jgi:hypothetical protein
MADDAKKPDIKLVETTPESVFDDIESLRKTAVLKVSRKTVPVNVAVKRPANNIYFRCHSDPEMSLDASVIVDKDDSNDFYFVTPSMLNHHTMLPRLRKVTITVVYAWPGGAISLWPVPLIEGTRIACWKSARAAFELSKEKWVQLCWNGDLRDYDVIVAEGIKIDPTWPNQSLQDLLRLGFVDKIISTPEHPYVLRLRGLAD